MASTGGGVTWYGNSIDGVGDLGFDVRTEIILMREGS
jgi:hypothetical protein